MRLRLSGGQAPAPSGQFLQPPDAQGQPLLVTEAVEASVLKVLDADGGNLLDCGVALGLQARSVLLQPEKSQPLLQAALKQI